MRKSFNDDDVSIGSRFVEIAHHALHQLVGSLRRNQPLGFFKRNRKRGPQARRGPDKVCGSLGSRGFCGRLTDRFAEGDAHAAIVERAHEAKSDRGETDFGSAGCEIKRVRHGIRKRGLM